MKRRTPAKASQERVLAKSQQVVLARAENRCEKCRWHGKPVQIHHRRPRGMGSSSLEWVNEPANLVALCPDDHAWTESHRAAAYESGWLLHYSAADASAPIAWPIFTAYGTYRAAWVRLDNEGGWTELPAPLEAAA